MVLDGFAEADYHFGMSDLRQLREAAGLSQTELGDLAGTSQPQIQRLETGDRKLTKEWASRLAPHLGVSPERLLFPPRKAVAVGYVGAGSEVYPIDDHALGEGLEEIDVPPGVPEDAVVVIVKGDSMYPRYFDGECLFYLRRGYDPRDLVGRECVVKLMDGRTFVKVLRKGSANGFFHLESWNAPVIEDRTVEWAAPVIARVNRQSR